MMHALCLPEQNIRWKTMSDFFSNFRQQALSEKLEIGDTVRVIGRDQFKGCIGTITRVKELSGECVYTVELQANSQRLERFKESLRKEY